MRLIDADAVLAALGIFHRHDNDNDNARHFMNGIETAIEIIEDAPDVEVPIKLLAKRLARYAMPPVHPKGLSQENLAEAWEEFLREMNRGEVNDDGGRTD